VRGLLDHLRPAVAMSDEIPSSNEVLRHLAFSGLDACRDWLLVQGLVVPVDGEQPKPTAASGWLLLTLVLLTARHDPDEWDLVRKHGDGIAAKTREERGE
jgi:hypothetical protein